MVHQDDIHTGDMAKDLITEFEGMVVAKTEWLNGCWRLSLQPKGMKDGKTVEAETFDVEQLTVTDCPHTVEQPRGFMQRIASAIAGGATGGPHEPPTRQATPPRR